MELVKRAVRGLTVENGLQALLHSNSNSAYRLKHFEQHDRRPSCSHTDTARIKQSVQIPVWQKSTVFLFYLKLPPITRSG